MRTSHTVMQLIFFLKTTFLWYNEAGKKKRTNLFYPEDCILFFLSVNRIKSSREEKRHTQSISVPQWNTG